MLLAAIVALVIPAVAEPLPRSVLTFDQSEPEQSAAEPTAAEPG
jgi:hypothetical protein